MLSKVRRVRKRVNTLRTRTGVGLTWIRSCLQIVSQVRAGYRSHIGWSAEEHKCYRLHQLQQLKKMLEENEKMICDALWTDLHKVSV